MKELTNIESNSVSGGVMNTMYVSSTDVFVEGAVTGGIIGFFFSTLGGSATPFTDAAVWAVGAGLCNVILKG